MNWSFELYANFQVEFTLSDAIQQIRDSSTELVFADKLQTFLK